MAPLKAATLKKLSIPLDSENVTAKSMSTRHTLKTGLSLQNSLLKKENMKLNALPMPKRKATTPIKGNTLKRSALVNITNAIETQCHINSAKKATKKSSSTLTKPTISTTAKLSLPPSAASVKPAVNTSTTSLKTVRSLKASSTVTSKNVVPPLPKVRSSVNLQGKSSYVPIQARPSLASVSTKVDAVADLPTTLLGKEAEKTKPIAVETKRSPLVKNKAKVTVTAKPKGTTAHSFHTRRSTRRSTLESTDSSLYVSALSEVDDESSISEAFEKSPSSVTPLIDIDQEYVNDPYQCAAYAYDIFEYLKKREVDFQIKDYMKSQLSLTEHYRAVLVDWMVEVQESFELNHETLYLGVKLVDSYLAHIKVKKEFLQLVGATAMLIAAKYDERIPPSIEEFLYICDGSYKRNDIMKMEVNMLKVVDYQLGFPLSYRFLRRYGRCAKVQMPLLTLARYILEYTLMDYSIIRLSDSKMAAAALFIAFKMKKEMAWDDTLIHFSGYRVKDFIDVAHVLNNFLHQKPRTTLQTVRNKYSHKVFYEVAKIPLVSNEELV